MINLDNCLYWDNFVSYYEQGCLYHLTKWYDVIKRCYAHGVYCLVAQKQDDDKQEESINKESQITKQNFDNQTYFDCIVGILPLIHINHRFFGNSLVSVPFFDSGGILNINTMVEKIILDKAINLADKLGVELIEIRQNYSLLSNFKYPNIDIQTGWNLSVSTNKVRMVLDIPDNPEFLLKSFNSKLRSQIRKPIKEGLIAKIGGIELIDDFYNVFAENMRDLGSPVHSKKFIAETLKAFPSTANIFIVYGNQKPLGGSVTIGFKDTLSNPWASSLRRYSHLAPNMLLYWSMLEFACQQGYKRFDFGRSTPGEGTYKFKEQWGAKPEPLYWYRLSKTSDRGWGSQPDKNKMIKAIEYWKKLPVPLTKIIGPRIRKYISL